jgi:hypothetical protein
MLAHHGLVPSVPEHGLLVVATILCSIVAVMVRCIRAAVLCVLHIATIDELWILWHVRFQSRAVSLG